MSDTKPMTAFFENRGLAPETYDYNLCMAAIEFATTAQVEQIAALTLQNARLREALKEASHALTCFSRFHATDRPDLVPMPEDLSFRIDTSKDILRIDQALTSPPADPSGLLALVRAVEKLLNRVSEYYIDDDAISDLTGELSVLYEEALDPAIKAAAERSVK